MDSERMRRKDWVSVVLLGLTVLGLNAGADKSCVSCFAPRKSVSLESQDLSSSHFSARADQNLMAPNLTAASI